MKKFIEFINEDASLLHHPLHTHKNSRKYDDDSEKLLESFMQHAKKENLIPWNMVSFIKKHNIKYDIPTLEFGMNPFTSAAEINRLKAHKLDNRTSGDYLLTLVDPDYLGDQYKADQHYKTMEAYLSDVPDNTQKFVNKWGYICYFTFFILTDEYSGRITQKLLVTFIKDPEMVRKYRGVITGKKFGL